MYGIVPVLDERVLAFALALTVIVALGTGFVPVLALVRGSGAESPRATAGRARGRLQGALLAAQIAAALTLLTGAGVLGKELLRLEKRGFGFDPKNVLWFPSVERPKGMRSVQFREDVLSGLARVPGVSSVSEFEQFANNGFYPEGDPSKAGKTLFDHQDVAISAPGLLKNLRIPVTHWGATSPTPIMRGGCAGRAGQQLGGATLLARSRAVGKAGDRAAENEKQKRHGHGRAADGDRGRCRRQSAVRPGARTGANDIDAACRVEGGLWHAVSSTHGGQT